LIDPRPSDVRITVVNDTPEFLELMDEILGREAGFDVSPLHGEQVTIDEIAGTRPDLLLIDLRLGGGNPTGWDIVLMARVDERLREVPVIVCSADVQQLRQREEEMSAMADVPSCRSRSISTSSRSSWRVCSGGRPVCRA